MRSTGGIEIFNIQSQSLRRNPKYIKETEARERVGKARNERRQGRRQRRERVSPVTPYKFAGAANLNMHESEKMAAEFGCTGKGRR